MKKRALISVFDKTNIIELATTLVANNYEIISTGGTYKYLVENNIEVVEVNEVTQFPEMLDGRLKTLHPFIHGGILAKRADEKHMSTVAEHQIGLIDVVVVNLYPFFEKLNEGLDEPAMIEFIDIGGPTMLRSAAKSFEDVVVLSDVYDYQLFITSLSEGKIDRNFRKQLAAKVFNLTSAYDAAIATYMLDAAFPTYLNTSYEKVQDLRYGENPHQQAAFYIDKTQKGAMQDMEQLNGKELSFNNIRDLDLAYKVVSEFDEKVCCAVKHSTPCGVATGVTVLESYQRAFACDPISIFGGIVVCNTEIDEDTAKEMNKTFLEIVAAPSFTEEALQVFEEKKNLRVLKINYPLTDTKEMVKVDGGLLVQNTDNQFSTELSVVTEAQPTEVQKASLLFAQKIVKHVKSNAIVVSSNQQALGIGAGQTNRIWATEQAIERALAKESKGLVLASDAFFPFRDVVDTCAKNGIEAIIQPGGSMRDQESIDACNEHNIPMIFTGMRHFKH